MKRRRWLGGGSFVSSLVFVFPLLIAYEISVVFVRRINGVDLFTRLLSWLVEGNNQHYLAVHAGFALAYVVALIVVRKKMKLERGLFLPMLLESAIYAATLGTFVVFIVDQLFSLPGLEQAIVSNERLAEVFEIVSIALGAGVHEEFLFRLVLFGGLAALLQRAGARAAVAFPFAWLFSSLTFSLAHHVAGEPFSVSVFTYRAVAGMIFALIFYFRSFSHAVYTHVLYDLYVLLLRT